MKGTRPRGQMGGADDAAILAQMQAEPKSRAENLMIVDLLRNDLSRLCAAGTVKVPELFALETYPTLHQMTSQVTGSLREDVSWREIFSGLFPCGSVTGAPKIRVMEIIQELEGGPRGAYCGGIGYIAPNGNAAFSVAIRTVQLKDGSLRYDVGSGVVLDSDGPDEYHECLLKSKIFETAPEGIIETMRRLPDGSISNESYHKERAETQIDKSIVDEAFDKTRAVRFTGQGRLRKRRPDRYHHRTLYSSGHTFQTLPIEISADAGSANHRLQNDAARFLRRRARADQSPDGCR